MNAPSLNLLLAELERRLRAKTRSPDGLMDWCSTVLSPQGQSPARHHRLLIAALSDVSAGRCDRLMVLMPPGSAKSTYTSVLFPAWWFSQHPTSAVIAASHTAELAERFGRRVRNLVMEHSARLGYTLAMDSKAAGRWETDRRGEYFAAGLLGPITGRRADLVVIDDPVKSQDEADSETIRDRAWDWYRSDLYTRLKPGGRVVVIQTRWHLDDLSGRLLDAMADGGDQWRVIKLPALAGPDDPLGRALGEPLWPEWEDVSALQRKRRQVGERAWSALYQQEPTPGEGLLFNVDRIAVLDAAPAGGKDCRGWDLAGTAGGGDWTVGVRLRRLPDGTFVVIDRVRLQGGPAEVEAAIVATATRDGKSVSISLPQDPGQAGKSQARYLVGRLAGFAVHATPETGDKAVRAQPVAAQANAGNLSLVRASWNASLLDEMASFPAGRHDDQVDALSRAFSSLLSVRSVLAAPIVATAQPRNSFSAQSVRI